MNKIEPAVTEIEIDMIRQTLSSKCACFVLITCSEPCAEGKMEVSMNYEGDENLAGFLIENASQVFNEKMHLRESQ
jgi:hypothetical protein